MDFPKNEAQTLLDWMRGADVRRYRDRVDLWNEHDRMSGAADFLGGLLSREGGDTEIYE